MLSLALAWILCLSSALVEQCLLYPILSQCRLPLVFYLSLEIPSLLAALVFCNSKRKKWPILSTIVLYKHLHLPAEHHLKGWHLGCLLLCSLICEQHWKQVFIPVILCIIHHLYEGSLESLVESFRESSCTRGQVHHEKHPCGVRSQTLRLVEILAMRRLLFHGLLEGLRKTFFQMLRCLPSLLLPLFVHICFCLNYNFASILKNLVEGLLLSMPLWFGWEEGFRFSGWQS